LGHQNPPALLVFFFVFLDRPEDRRLVKHWPAARLGQRRLQHPPRPKTSRCWAGRGIVSCLAAYLPGKPTRRLLTYLLGRKTDFGALRVFCRAHPTNLRPAVVAARPGWVFFPSLRAVRRPSPRRGGNTLNTNDAWSPAIDFRRRYPFDGALDRRGATRAGRKDEHLPARDFVGSCRKEPAPTLSSAAGFTDPSPTPDGMRGHRLHHRTGHGCGPASLGGLELRPRQHAPRVEDLILPANSQGHGLR